MIAIKKSTMYYGIIFITIMLNLNIFFLVDTYGNFRFFGIPLYDITFFWNLIWIFTSLLYSISYGIKRSKDKFFLVVIFACILVFTSSYIGTKTYNQPLIYGLVSQRLWISCLLMYFPFDRWLNSNKITINGIVRTLKIICVMYLSICILQYLLSNKIQFTYVATSTRYGEVRYRFDCLFLVLLSGFTIDNIILNKKNHKVDILILGAIFFVIVVIAKGRMQIISWLAAIVICMLIRKEHILKKYFFVLVMIISLYFFVSSTSLGQDILDIFWGSGTGVSEDTLTIRDVSKEYYLNLLKTNGETILFGYGSVNNSWEIAREIARPTIGNWVYHTSDNGIYGYAFYYGILGVIWWIVSMTYCLYLAFKVYKKTGKFAYLQFVLVDFISCSTLVPYLFNNMCIMPIYMVLLKKEINQIK